MGWHWGASIAFNTARAWPQRMLRLVLAAPPISDPAIIRFVAWTHGAALKCIRFAPCLNVLPPAINHQTTASCAPYNGPAVEGHTLSGAFMTDRSLPGVFPVLLLWAARDAVVPLRLAQSFVTELGPRLTLSVSLDDGDAAIPPELLRAVHQFLSS